MRLLRGATGAPVAPGAGAPRAGAPGAGAPGAGAPGAGAPEAPEAPGAAGATEPSRLMSPIRLSMRLLRGATLAGVTGAEATGAEAKTCRVARMIQACIVFMIIVFNA